MLPTQTVAEPPLDLVYGSSGLALCMCHAFPPLLDSRYVADVTLPGWFYFPVCGRSTPADICVPLPAVFELAFTISWDSAAGLCVEPAFQLHMTPAFLPLCTGHAHVHWCRASPLLPFFPLCGCYTPANINKCAAWMRFIYRVYSGFHLIYTMCISGAGRLPTAAACRALRGALPDTGTCPPCRCLPYWRLALRSLLKTIMDAACARLPFGQTLPPFGASRGQPLGGTLRCRRTLRRHGAAGGGGATPVCCAN